MKGMNNALFSNSAWQIQCQRNIARLVPVLLGGDQKRRISPGWSKKKWGEVVSALKLEGNSVKLCAQVEMLYAHILYQFEKLYFYRQPAKQAGSNKRSIIFWLL